MIAEEDLLPLSALQHLLFCKRRVGLVHLERIWAENVFTAEGAILHQKVHESSLVETRGNTRIARGLSVKSLRLGLSGKLDVVEFHQEAEDPAHPASELSEPNDVLGWLSSLEKGNEDESENDSTGKSLPFTEQVSAAPVGACRHHSEDASPIWRPYPVEYKRGRIRHEQSFEVQLCAQGICLEEMLGIAVPEGAIFYGGERRRVRVEFTEDLRSLTEESARTLHEIINSGRTPPPEYGRKCRSCSLKEVCLPQPCAGKRPVSRYLAAALEET